MGVTRTGIPEDSSQEPRADRGTAPAQSSEAPTSPLLLGSASDRCTNCGATLASDQRYCVECGERRGSSRFGVAGPTAQTTEVASSPSRPPEGRHHSSGATIVAGIATLVLAMGVGVLIGRTGNNNSTPAKAAAPTVVTVNGGSGGSTPSQTHAATTTTPSNSNKSHSASSGGSSSGGAKNQSPKTEAQKANKAAAAKAPTQAAKNNASHAAQSVLGGSGGQSNNTVQQGGSCKAGSAGCQNGHFTGNFFGP